MVFTDFIPYFLKVLLSILFQLLYFKGSRDVIDGEEYSPEYEGYDGPRDPNKLRSKKHKTKKRYL